jgi:hypothetical protein
MVTYLHLQSIVRLRSRRRLRLLKRRVERQTASERNGDAVHVVVTQDQDTQSASASLIAALKWSRNQ